MLLFPPNNPGIKVRIRREKIIIVGPLVCNVQSASSRQYPEFYSGASSAPSGENTYTHTIYTSNATIANGPDSGKSYIPFMEDILIVSGSTDGLLDGEYVIKEYSSNQVGMNQSLNHIKFLVRFLGTKKPGDTKSNNKTNLRFGDGN